MVVESDITSSSGDFFIFNTLYSILNTTDKQQLRGACQSAKTATLGMPKAQMLQQAVQNAIPYFGDTVIAVYVTTPLLQTKVMNALNQNAGKVKTLMQSQYATTNNMKTVSENVDVLKAAGLYLGPVQTTAGIMQLTPF